jgi:hypothetical protein
MTPQHLQELFGTETGRVYAFDGSVPAGEEPIAAITEEFATAAGTNLVDAVVTNIGGAWAVYTRNTIVTDEKFRLVVELPLPVEEIPTEEPPNAG